jgi:hypothetical protein
MEAANDELLEAIKENTRQLKQLNGRIGDWKWLLWRGALMGFAGVLGATVVVSVVVSVLQPFSVFETLGPTIERLIKELQHD